MQYIILNFNKENLNLINNILNLDLTDNEIQQLFQKIKSNSLFYLSQGFDKIVFEFKDIILKYCNFETILRDFSKIIYIPTEGYEIILGTGILYSKEKIFEYNNNNYDSIIIQKKVETQHLKSLYNGRDVCFQEWDNAIEKKYSKMFLNTLKYLKDTNKLTLHSKQAGFFNNQPILFDW